MKPVRPLRFGPDPNVLTQNEKEEALRVGRELGRIICEAFERMRKPLWFWEVQNG